MLSNFELKIIFRFLSQTGRYKFIGLVNMLAVTGIALGVMTLIIVMSVMNGYETQFMQKLLGVNGNYTITTRNNEVHNYDEAVQKIKQLSFVNYTAPILNGQAIIQHDKKTTGVMVKGVEESLFFAKPIIKNNLNTKSSVLQNNHIYIGAVLADSLSLKVGDNIQILTPKFTQTLFGAIAKMKTFEVAGIFDLGWHEYNAGIVYININTAQKRHNSTICH